MTTLPSGLTAAILAQSADAIIYADREGYIRLWNAAAEAMFGFAANEAIGQSLDIFIPERLRAPHWAGYRMAMENGRTKHAGRPTLTKGLTRSGETIYVEMSFAVVTGGDGVAVGSVAMARLPREAPQRPVSGKDPFSGGGA